MRRTLATSAADTCAAAVALALVVGGLPLPARAGAPEVPRDEPVEPVSPPIEVAASGLPPELIAPPVAALGEARRLEADGRFAEAARIFEARWQATADARFLYHAALARSRAGHHAAALRLLSQCLELLRAGLSEPARQFLEDARERERAATVPVQLRVVEWGAGGIQPVPEHALADARTTARRIDATGRPVSGDRFEIAGPLPGEIRLDPGVWRVEVEIPGFMPGGLQAAIDGSQGPQDIVVQRRKVIVDLRFVPERAVRGARLKLYATDHASPLALERDLLAPTTTVTLTPGRWQLMVRARRHGADLNLTIGPGQRPIEIQLVRRPPADDQRLTRDRKLLLGVLGSFGATYLAGVGLLVGAANLEKRAEGRDARAHEDAGVDPKLSGAIDPAAQEAIEASYPAARLRRDLAFASDLHVAGGVMSGVSVGAMLSALPTALRGRRRAQVIELGVGVALTASGAGWLGWSLGERARVLDGSQRVSPEALDRGDGHRIASSLLTGLGLGLTFFSAVVLAGDAAARRKRARAFASAPWAAPGLAGLSMTGRF